MNRLLILSLFILILLIGINAQQIVFSKFPGASNLHSGCTVVSISKGDSVFFGGNDDYILSDSYYWVEPGDSTKYGVIWIGKSDNPQQGINEK